MNSYFNDTILDSMDFMLLFIDLVLYLKAFEHLAKVHPPYSLSHRQNGKKVYYEYHTVFCERPKTAATEAPNAQML